MSNDLNNIELEKYILDLVKNIKFGAVSLQIHDSKIVQIEKSEKFRFENNK